MTVEEWKATTREIVNDRKKYSQYGFILEMAESASKVRSYEYKSGKLVRTMWLWNNPEGCAYPLLSYMSREIKGWNPADHDLSVLKIDGEEIARLSSNSHWEFTVKQKN